MSQNATISLHTPTRLFLLLLSLLFIAVFLEVFLFERVRVGPFNIGSECAEHAKASENFTSSSERLRVLTSERASLLAENRHMKEILSKQKREGRGITNEARSADNFNVSSDTTHATRGKILISQGGSDGMGHQMLGMYSCMLLPLVDDRFQYVRKINVKSGHTRSKQLIRLFDVLQCNANARPPGSSPAAMNSGKFRKFRNVLTKEGDFGKLTAAMLSDFGGELRNFKDVVELDHHKRGMEVICRKNRTSCELGMRKLSISLRSCFLKSDFKTQFSQDRSHREILMHVRGGDRPGWIRRGMEKHPYTLEFIRQQTGIDNVVIAVEFEKDKKWIEKNWIPKISQTSPLMKVSYLVAADPVETFFRFVRADILIMGSSSFSVSAGLLRTGPTFSETQSPIKGNYDVRVFSCVVDLDLELKLPNSTAAGKVFFEEGGHGSPSCNLKM